MFLTICFPRGRVAANPNPSRQYDQNRNVAEHFASDHVVNRYLYDNLNVPGQNRSVQYSSVQYSTAIMARTGQLGLLACSKNK